MKIKSIISSLRVKVDTTSIAVGGFLHGNGGAQLVPNLNPNISAILSLYPWLDNPSNSDLNHSVPTMIVSGQLDAIAPPGIHANIHYNLIPNTTKKLNTKLLLLHMMQLVVQMLVLECWCKSFSMA